MRNAVMMLCAAAMTAGCAGNSGKKPESYQYAKAATFVEHKFNYKSDIALFPTEHESALWLGNPRGARRGEWVITEMRTVTVVEPRIIQGQVQNVPVEKVVPIRQMEQVVYFDFDSSKIRPDAKSTLEALPLKEADGYVIDAHTDALGTDNYNDKLSIRRAKAVKKWLVSKGVPESQITISAHGEKNPVAPNKDQAGRAKNRRATIILSLQHGQAPSAPAAQSAGPGKADANPPKASGEAKDAGASTSAAKGPDATAANPSAVAPGGSK